MADRLTPAQQQVVDAMRDGAELCRNAVDRRFFLWWSQERHRGKVHAAVARNLIRRGVVVAEAHPFGGPGRLVLAPAYRPTEEAR